MIALAVQDFPWAKVSDIELQREGLSYSVDTVEYFRQEYRDIKLFWIMGSDQWEVFDTWYRSEDLVGMLEFIVFPRPVPPQEQAGKQLHAIEYQMDISSSQIREHLAHGKEVTDSLQPEVERYIRSRGLYLK